MKDINATPKTIQKLFTDIYEIPEFQRPYSWELEHCEKLWEDLINFHENLNAESDDYFLGNIVVHTIKGNYFSVIDGQQRLTTLLLLMQALFSKAQTLKTLEACLKITDELTGEIQNSLRVTSKVQNDDKESLRKVIFENQENLIEKNIFLQNYQKFIHLIETWLSEKSRNADDYNSLIKTILYKITILRIECPTQDNALDIFETINNRGMSLTDADIFKAKLYKEAINKDDFMHEWNALNNHDRLFRLHMYVHRAKNKDASKEIGLRKYFSKPSCLQLDMPFLMASLKLYSAVDGAWGTPKINVIWHIFNAYPNQYWQYPIYVYLRKHGIVEEDEFILSKNHELELELLMENILRYFIVKGLVFNSVNSIKDSIFKLCNAIWHEEDYLKNFNDSYNVSTQDFLKLIGQGNLGRYVKFLVMTCSFLDSMQQKELNNLQSMFESKYDIEHILPKKWNHYDQWTMELWRSHINSIGNLVIFEKSLNIKASNEFFTRKQEYYKKSKCHSACKLADQKEGKWFPEHVIERKASNIKLLSCFLYNIKISTAAYIGDYKIEIVFNNGKKGVSDLSDSLDMGVFKPLLDRALFSQFRIDPELDTVVWSGGQDLAPEFLYFKAFQNDPALHDQFVQWGYIH